MPFVLMTNMFFEGEKVKAFKEVNTVSKNKILKRLDQVGKSNTFRDERRTALPAGKRVSKNGKVYWETRKNRSDAEGSKT